VHPKGNPSQIKMKVKWAEAIELDKKGIFKMKNSMGEIIEDAPISFQGEVKVNSSFQLNGDILSFNLDQYDKNKTIVIDPSIDWCSYYGGDGFNSSYNVEVDLENNYYISGMTASSTFIASGGHQNSQIGGYSLDAFLLKLDSKGQRLWCTYYGGNGSEIGMASAVDDNNNVYLLGSTSSRSDIAFNGFKNYLSPFSRTAYLVKFDKDGHRKWATYFGYRSMSGDAICIKNNFIFIAGYWKQINDVSSAKDTNISYLGHQNMPGNSIGNFDGYIAKFDTIGNRLWATYYGGNNDDIIRSIASDSQENIYVTGVTNSLENISYLGFQNNLNKGISSSYADGFIAKFNTNGTRIWGTYLGSGYGGDTISSCTVDRDNNLLVIGSTGDSSLMTISTMPSGQASFIAKFNSRGNKIWSLPLALFPIRDIASDKGGNVYITGHSNFNNGLFFNGFKNYISENDVIISKFDKNGVLSWSSYYGGLGNDAGISIAIDSDSLPIVSGVTGFATNATLFSDSLAVKGFQSQRIGTHSNSLILKICQDPRLPEIALLSNCGTNICAGKEVIFNTQTKNAGLTPVYIWKKNGQNAGTNQATYTTNQLNDKDSIECWMVSSAGCISQDTVKSNKLVFRVIKPDTTYANDTACEGRVYRFGSQNLTSTGTYQARLQDVNGCDSLVYLSLWFKPKSVYNFNHTTTCAQPSYFFNGQTRTVSGEYRDTLIGQNGCDSLIILKLTVKAPSSYNYSYQLCEGDSVAFGANYIKLAGTYQRVIPNAAGCDSTITMIVSILKPVKKDSVLQACPPYSYKGRNYEISTKILDTLYSYQGCDSIYLTIDAQIKNKPERRGDIRYEACDSMRISGRLYRSSFQYIDTIRTKDALKCDSIYQPYYYTIYETPSARFYSRTKDTMLRGQTLKLRANSAEHYLWSTGHKESSLEFKLIEDVQIYLIAWNHELCKDTSYLDLWAFDPIILDFPTGFNPMSSYPENRFFRPNYTGKLDAMQFDIFNRLGEKVYSSSSIYDLGWDGNYKNQLAPTGVYTYILEYTSFRSRYIKTGEVMLVR
ncbi:MAG: SBBP repeat-containing protein, partial [Chitinophagales bacterium]